MGVMVMPAGRAHFMETLAQGAALKAACPADGFKSGMNACCFLSINSLFAYPATF